MKKSGILNGKLAGLIGALGHMDTILVGDAGMPIPKGIEIVDLAICGGVPTFIQVMDALLKEVEIEAYTVALEINNKNPQTLKYIRENLPHAEENITSHLQLKSETANVKFAIRTGEFTPYANIILRAGVVF